MNSRLLFFKFPLLVCLGLMVTSCSKDDDADSDPTPSAPSITVPGTYSFERNGESSVSYSGQTDRLNQLSEIKDLLKAGDAGSVIDAQALMDMYENIGDNGGGNFSFSSSKQLKNKTLIPDVSYYENLFTETAAASVIGESGTSATNGQAGLILRGNGNTVLVDENGKEFTQLIEKGLMGSVFLNQIFNTYLTVESIGPNSNNTDLEEGKNYTEREHHFDEAFGYFGAPIDFGSNYSGSEDVRFWANYSDVVDTYTGSSNTIMTAYKTARAAIVANDAVELEKNRIILYKELERVSAATAIHYANDALEAPTDGDRLHVLSECYAFIQALRVQHIDHKTLSNAEVEALLVTLGDNFWETTTSGLNEIKNKLASAYNLETVKNDL